MDNGHKTLPSFPALTFLYPPSHLPLRLTSDPSTRVTPAGLDERLVEIFRGVGALMSRYTVGKLPKAFKVIPTLKNWEEVLALTEPEAWSPHAIYQATRIFVSNLNQRLVGCNCSFWRGGAWVQVVLA